MNDYDTRTAWLPLVSTIQIAIKSDGCEDYSVTISELIRSRSVGGKVLRWSGGVSIHGNPSLSNVVLPRFVPREQANITIVRPIEEIDYVAQCGFATNDVLVHAIADACTLKRSCHQQ